MQQELLFQHAAGLHIKATIEVSCDTWQASGCVRFSQPAICSGDQFRSSLAATACRNWSCTANLHGFGRRARSQARLSEAAARYGPEPPLRAISRPTVDGARPRLQAIRRNECPCTNPREISSRSASVSASLERRRGDGRIPPLGLMCAKIEDEVLPNTRPIDFSPSPLRHRSHISALSAAVKKRRFRRSPITLHLPLKGKVLRRPVETTAKIGHSQCGKRTFPTH
jgi:hypothetical protein